MDNGLPERKTEDIVYMEAMLCKPKKYWVFKSCSYVLAIMAFWSIGYKLMLGMPWQVAISSAVPIAVALSILLPAAEFWFLNVLVDLKRGEKLEWAKLPGTRILLKAIVAAFILESLVLILLNKFVQ